jgi:RNA recognition motif-containing protein
MIIFTAVPPPSNWDEERIRKRAEEFVRILESAGLRIMNIPEVPQKVSPIEFSRVIKGINENMDVIIDKVVSKEDLEEIFREISEITDKVALVNVGEKEGVVRLAKEYFREVYGIAIFSREGEDFRLFKRTVWGFDGFISQIIFETESLKRTLEGYYGLCEREGIKPAKIFVSIAPIRGERDINFLEGFRVEIPENVKMEILAGRGLDVAKALAEEVLSLKLGINVEYVMMDNLILAGELLRWLVNRETQNRTIS